ncbi:MAG TPA: hypothetical protein VFJ99_07305 [Solirubrobacterales bacterium]|nr:hypothetical protein [Solirubrobacterales bacterium]
MEPAARQPVFDRGRRQPELDKLPTSHDPMLSLCQLPHEPVY